MGQNEPDPETYRGWEYQKIRDSMQQVDLAACPERSTYRTHICSMKLAISFGRLYDMVVFITVEENSGRTAVGL